LAVRDDEMRFVTSAVKRNTSADEREEKTMARTAEGHDCSKKMEADEQPSSDMPELCVGDDSAAIAALLRR
jgi:hypothetical protein